MASVDHTSRKHALLSASGASRWLNCTPSARLEQKFDESAQSAAAAEGTLAHEFGDINLRFKLGEITKRVYDVEIAKLRKDKLYTDEMEGEVDKYVTYCLEAYAVAQQNPTGAVMLVEEKFDFSHLVEQGFGTGDATIISDGTLDIIDLKYGKGIRVDADDNPQLKLYASGALHAFDLSYDIHTVRMHIVQPRLDHISVFEMSVTDLIAWGQKIVTPAAKKAYLGKGVQKAGDWCKWCKVKAMCATLAAANVKLAQHEFKDPHLLSDQQLVDVYKQQPMLVDWVNAVKDHLLTEALKGKHWPGYKLVEGKSNRKWADEKKAIEVIEAEGFDRSLVVNEKIKPLGQLEKLLGKAGFNAAVGEYLIKPPGAPTLVEASDKRPAINSAENAKADFTD